MAGGMVPPLAIALATTFFKNRFTKSEQQTTVTNYIMGLSFITEGAIPFAASDPLRIIPPCVVGSAIAGALSMAFGCGSRAPHGRNFRNRYYRSWSDVPFSNPDRSSCGNGRNRFVEKTTES